MSETLAQPGTQANQRYHEVLIDTQTMLAELVDGTMMTSFELEFDGREVYGPDGRTLSSVSEKALAVAQHNAALNPELAFEVPRREHEDDEIALIPQIAKGELPNTMVIVSDYPEALTGYTKDIAGYSAKRKQTMLRVITLRPDGNVQMYSQSLDGSNRSALEAIYGSFGLHPEHGDLLGQRIHVDLPEEERELVVDRLTGVYDRSLSQQFGGEWHAGRRTTDLRNTYDFVCAQQDLVNEYVRLWINDELTENIIYDFAATIQKRFISGANETNLAPMFSSAQPAQLYHELKMAGQEARSRKETFNGCGFTLNPEELDTEGMMKDSGYGNKDGIEDGDCDYVSKKCPLCNAKNVKTQSRKIGGKLHVNGSCGCSKVY